jgi:AcrR family transcriptional regulator
MPKVSQDHQLARRRQIIDAAITCFARDGFHRATMQDICREGQLSPGAIYRYFPAKEDIIEAIARERHEREAGYIGAAIAVAGPADALRQMGRAFFRSLDDPAEKRRRRLGVEVWAEALRNPKIMALLRRGIDPSLQATAELIRTGQKSGDISADLDPDSAARAILALFQGFILQQAWYGDIDVEAYLATVETLFSAVLHEERPVTIVGEGGVRSKPPRRRKASVPAQRSKDGGA